MLARDVAMQELPTAYAVALRLHEAGVDDEKLACGLEVPVESIPKVLSIARSKLEAVMVRGVRDPDAS